MRITQKRTTSIFLAAVVWIFTVVILSLILTKSFSKRYKITQKLIDQNSLSSKEVSQTKDTPTPFKQSNRQFLSIVQHGNRKYPQIALTFDADMTPYMLKELDTGKIKSFYNKKIVDYLEKEKVPATIFMAGLWAERYPDIAKKLAQDPLFEIANHSYSHPSFTEACFGLPSIPSWGREAEFTLSQKAISQASGITPKYFRFPGGCHSDSDVKLANKYGLTVVDWDAASGDSFNNNLQSIVKNVETKTQNGSIILFHFHGTKDAPLTDRALPIVIPYLQQKGFKFVKLSELLALLNK